MQKYILVFTLLFLVTACSNDEQAATPAASVATVPTATAATTSPLAASQSAASKLIFFLDPNGGPCRMQAAILDQMANEFTGKVDIQYVQTTVAADQNIFYKYGIRALPTLLLADASGKEIKRMPPGVKRADDIRLLMQSIPRS